MGNIDGLREQVEELKQRLNEPDSQQIATPSELKTRLTSIKASLESKQGEITQLTAEKNQLAAEKERFAAEMQRLSAEMQRLSAENEQLRKMLKELLSALDGRPADAATDILSEFFAETDALVNPKRDGAETVIAAGPPAGAAAAGPAKTEKAESKSPCAAAEAADTQTAKQPEQGAAGEEADEEESPALRRIMKRGHRAAG